MRLSIDILAEDLKEYIEFARISRDSEMDLAGVRFLEENGEAPDPLTLYVGTKLPMEIPEAFHMLYLGRDLPKELPGRCSILKIKETCSEHRIFNQALNVFQRYGEWEDTLQRLLEEHAPLAEFLNVSQPILKAGICLLDWDHNCIAVTRVKMDNCPLWDAILDGYGYKYKFVIEQSNPKLNDLTRSKGMTQNWSNIDQRYLYNVPLFINGFAMFGIGLHKMEDPTIPFGRNTAQLLEVLADVMTQRLIYENQVHPTRSVLYDAFIRDLIDNRVQDPDEVNRQNHYIHRVEDDHLTIGIVVFKDIKYRSAFLSYCAKELESLWPSSTCSVVDCQLLWILNLKEQLDYQFISEERKRDIDKWMKEKVARCGLSPSFRSLTEVHRCYAQASCALHYGLACGYEDQKYVYGYFDRLDYQILSLASVNTDLTTLVHRMLQQLLQYDEMHRTNYYETLKTYLLFEYSLTFNEIADKLHLHRNTLHYRLDKIQEIIHLDIKDTMLKRQLELSIHCFDLFPKCTYDG